MMTRVYSPTSSFALWVCDRLAATIDKLELEIVLHHFTGLGVDDKCKHAS